LCNRNKEVSRVFVFSSVKGRFRAFSRFKKKFSDVNLKVLALLGVWDMEESFLGFFEAIL